MRVLVIGSGGREHTLVWKIAQSSRVEKIYCIPGNPGIKDLAECIEIDILNNAELVKFAQENKIDLTVVGPELPLTNGIVDEFVAAGLRIFGPSKVAAQIEGSKAFAKELMHKYNIPTAKFAVFSEANEAREYLKKSGAPVVIKADGLAAGKGVVVAMTMEEAMAAIDMIMCERTFGNSGNSVVIEEFLVGEEASLLAFSDGCNVVPMVAAQDHKRIYDGDMGPNTGGMGAYAPAPVITAEIKDVVLTTILQPVVKAMQEEGCIYRGCLYAGLIITAEGPKVIEFNARFGDPETQVVLPLLDSDLTVIMEACIDGRLDQVVIDWKNESAVCVVMASRGYPASSSKGDVITGLKQATERGAYVLHAGTAEQAGSLVTSGGRVLGVTAVAHDIKSAVDKAYQAVREISFPGMQYRKDIAYRAIKAIGENR